MVDLSKSISELEGWKWESSVPTLDDSSYEEYQFYVLHNKPIKEYNIEDIYFMIGQNASLDILVPLAITYLNQNIFIKADDYQGDLLERLLILPEKFWSEHPDEKQKMLELLSQHKDSLMMLEETWEIKKTLKKKIQDFL